MLNIFTCCSSKLLNTAEGNCAFDKKAQKIKEKKKTNLSILTKIGIPVPIDRDKVMPTSLAYFKYFRPKQINMEIGKNKVVTLNYTLKNSDGMVLDTSEGREPLVYLQGVGALIPGLENELKGKEKGDKFDTVIAAKDAYGEKRDDLVQVVPKEGFQGDEELEIGMQVQVEKEGGAVIATVINIEGEEVTLDMNHMLAGMELHFNVEVMDIREASEEEISHGHVHGAGGHHH